MPSQPVRLYQGDTYTERKRKSSLVINPFNATACKICGLKSAHMHARKQYIRWSYNKSTFNTVRFDRNPFMCPYEGGKTSFNSFKFGTFIGRFPSNGVAGMAMNRLRCSSYRFPNPTPDTENKATQV